jgi:DNA-binding MarR family transcriptional regulator
MQDADLFATTLRKWVFVSMRNSMRNFIFYLKERELSMSQIGTLFLIHRGSSNISDIAEELGVTKAAASQMLERMVQQNLILRTEDPNDRRVKQVVLTDNGRQVVRESIAARQVWLDNLVRSLSDCEKEQIDTALNILIDKAIQIEQHPEAKRLFFVNLEEH